MSTFTFQEYLDAIQTPHATKNTWRKIINHFGLKDPAQIAEKILTMSAEDIAEVGKEENETLGLISAKAIVEGLKHPDIQFAIRNYHHFVKIQEAADTSAISPEFKEKIKGKAVCFTGTAPISRDQLADILRECGCKPSSGVSSKTDFLLIEDMNSSSSKAKKARELIESGHHIQIIEYAQIFI